MVLVQEDSKRTVSIDPLTWCGADLDQIASRILGRMTLTLASGM